MIQTDLKYGVDYNKKKVLFIAEKHIKPGGKLDLDAIVATAKLECQAFRVISDKGQELRSSGFISEAKIIQWN